MTSKHRMEDMTPAEFREAVSRRPVFILPTGILEWHGDHLPLGLDALKMKGIAERLAQQADAILLPQNWFGVVGFDEMLGTVTFSKLLVKQIAAEFFLNLEKLGAKLIVLLTGHYGPYQLETIKEAAEEYMGQSGVRIIAQAEYEDVDFTSCGIGPDHAGRYETSLAMALFPHLVQMEHFQRELNIPTEYSYRPNHWGFRSPQGTWSFDADLRQQASADFGEQIIEMIVDHLRRRIDEELARCGT